MSEDWDREGPYGHPVVATLTGVAILVLAAVLGPNFCEPVPLPALLMGGAAAGLILWLVGFLLTTRHAGLGWKLGSLALLIAAGAGAALIAHGQFQTRSRADASSFADLELGTDGTPSLPAGAASRGPVSRLYLASIKEDQAAARAYGDALGKFGAGALTSPYMLQQNPQVTGHCGDIEKVRALAAEQSAARLVRRKALAEAIGSASLPKATKLGIAKIAGDAQADPLLANQQAMLDATAELCTLLARKSWTNANGYFGFGSGSDAAAFKAVSTKRQAIAAEAEALDRTTRERILAGREQVRTALSRSIYAGE